LPTNGDPINRLQLLAESALVVLSFYALQVRSLSFNLKDPANPDLRARVLQGEIDPQVRCKVTIFECACDRVDAV
jgi:hypothetical protein